MTLHTLMAGASSEDEAKARVNLFAGMLAQRFPDEVYTDCSLEHVAAMCRFWPAYGELVDGLREFTPIYRHRPLALPCPTDCPSVSKRAWTWLMTLHTMTAGASSTEEAEARVNLFARMLAQRFPDEVYTERSLEHVARRCRFWPAYAELVDGLREFARTYLPRRLALPAPREEGRPQPKDAELRHVRGAIEGLIADFAVARVEREAAQPGPMLRSLPDVTAKGEALERIRASGRVVAKAGAAPDAAAEGRPRDDRRADAARRRPASRTSRRAGA